MLRLPRIHTTTIFALHDFVLSIWKTEMLSTLPSLSHLSIFTILCMCPTECRCIGPQNAGKRFQEFPLNMQRRLNMTNYIVIKIYLVAQKYPLIQGYLSMGNGRATESKKMHAKILYTFLQKVKNKICTMKITQLNLLYYQEK